MKLQNGYFKFSRFLFSQLCTTLTRKLMKTPAVFTSSNNIFNRLLPNSFWKKISLFNSISRFNKYQVCFWKSLKLFNTKNLHCCLVVLFTCMHYPKNAKGFTNSLTVSLFSINSIVLINKLISINTFYNCLLIFRFKQNIYIENGN